MPTDTLAVTEIFCSLQGEGHFVGTPSIFIRLWGCNFECPGFGQPRDHEKWIKKEAMLHNQKEELLKVTDIADLPIPAIGCDSSFSWSKHTRHLATEYTPEELADKVFALLNETQTRLSDDWRNDVHLVITGGEPLIPKWQKLLAPFFIAYGEKFGEKVTTHFQNVTFETNGTYELKNSLADAFNDEFKHVQVTFSVSPKLSVSGESRERALKPQVVRGYQTITNSFLYLKYVVRDWVCMEEVDSFTQAYDSAMAPIREVYLMPEGGTTDEIALTEKGVAEICKETGYRFSPRLHMNLYQNEWGT